MGDAYAADKTRTSLIRRVRDVTDAEGWREFTELYRPLLLSYARRQGLKEDDAQDVVQDVFIKLLKTLPGFELDGRRGQFRTWLWQVTRNAIVDKARSRLRRGNAERAYLARLKVLVDSPDRMLEAEFTAAHRQRLLDAALRDVEATAQPATWACYDQHILKGRASAEVAAELGLTVGAVNTNASRVHKKVRERCAYYEGELGDD